MGKVLFYRLTENLYKKIKSPNTDAIYFLTDSKQIYLNNKAYGKTTNVDATASVTSILPTLPGYVDVTKTVSNSSTLLDFAFYLPSSQPLQGNYIDVNIETALEGYISLPDLTVPVAVLIDDDVFRILHLVKLTGSYKIRLLDYIVQLNKVLYSNIWRIWRAGGKAGVGIRSIYQSVLSLLDRGINEIKVILTNSDSQTFYIRNGGGGGGTLPNYVDITLISGNTVNIPGLAVPVSILILNQLYSINDGSLVRNLSNSSYTLNIQPYLARHNVPQFYAPWRVWKAGGKAGVGIRLIFQSVISLLDLGINKIRVILTNSDSQTFYIRNGSKGSPGYLNGNYIDVTLASDSYILINDTRTLPVAVLIDKSVYNISDGALLRTESDSHFILDIKPFLTRHNIPSFDTPWRIWMAGGTSKDLFTYTDMADDLLKQITIQQLMNRVIALLQLVRNLKQRL